MNDEQQYQKYLNDGGSATFEEFLSVKSDLPETDFNALLGNTDSEKKKTLQNPQIAETTTPSPMTTALPISNDLELNPAQEQAIAQAQADNSLESGTLENPASLALPSTEMVSSGIGSSDLNLNPISTVQTPDLSNLSQAVPVVVKPKVNDPRSLLGLDAVNDTVKTPINQANNTISAQNNAPTDAVNEDVFKLQPNEVLETIDYKKPSQVKLDVITSGAFQGTDSTGNLITKEQELAQYQNWEANGWGKILPDENNGRPQFQVNESGQNPIKEALGIKNPDAYDQIAATDKAMAPILRGAESENKIRQLQEEALGVHYIKQNGLLTRDEFEQAKYDKLVQDYVNQGNTQQEAVALANEFNQNQTATKVNNAKNYIDGILQRAQSVNDLFDGKAKENSALTASEKQGWNKVLTNYAQDFADYLSEEGYNKFGEVGDYNFELEAGKATGRRRILDDFFNWKKQNLVDYSIVLKNRDEQAKMNINKAIERRDAQEVQQYRELRNTDTIAKINQEVEKFKQINQDEININKDFDVTEKLKMDAAREYAGYENGNVGDVLSYTTKTIGTGLFKVAADVVAAPFALASPISKTTRQINETLNSEIQNPFNVLQSGWTDKIKVYKDEKTGKDYEERFGFVYEKDKDGNLKLVENLTYNGTSGLKFIKNDTDTNLASAGATIVNMTGTMLVADGIARTINSVVPSRLLGWASKSAEALGKESLFTKALYTGAEAAQSYNKASALAWSYITARQNMEAAQQAGLSPTQSLAYTIFQSAAAGLMTRVHPDNVFFKDYSATNKNLFKLLSQNKIEEGKLLVSDFVKKYGKTAFGENVQEFSEQVVQDFINQGFNFINEKDKNGKDKFATTSIEDYFGIGKQTSAYTFVLNAFNALGKGKIRTNGMNNLEKAIVASQIPEAKQMLYDLSDRSMTGYTFDKANDMLNQIAEVEKYTKQIPDGLSLNVAQTADIIVKMQQAEALKAKIKENGDSAVNGVIQTQLDEVNTSIDATLKKGLEQAQQKKYDLNAKTGDQLVTTETTETPIQNEQNPQSPPQQEAVQTQEPIAEIKPSKKIIEPTIITDKEGKQYTINQYGQNPTDNGLMITVQDGNKVIASANFTTKKDGSISSEATNVQEPYRRKGIATAMYDYMRQQGFDITPAPDQLNDGKQFTDSYFNKNNDPKINITRTFNPKIHINFKDKADLSKSNIDLSEINYEIADRFKDDKSFGIVSKDKNGNDLARVSVREFDGELQTDGIYLSDPKTLAGKNLGLQAAIEMVKEARRRNEIITNSPISITPAGKKLWDTLVEQGYAIPLGKIANDNGDLIDRYQTTLENNNELNQETFTPEEIDQFEAKLQQLENGNTTTSTTNPTNDGGTESGTNSVSENQQSGQGNSQTVSATSDSTGSTGNVEVKTTVQPSKNGKYDIQESIDNNGNTTFQLLDKKGKVVNPKSYKTKAEYVAEVINEKIYPETDFSYQEGMTEADMQSEMLDKSNNPKEIAQILATTPKYDAENIVGSKQWAIAQVIGKNVNRESFVRFGDSNNITDTIARTYFSPQKGGKGIDQIAMDASEVFNREYSSDAITTQDVVDFIMEFPGDPSKAERPNNPLYDAAEAKFIKLTGERPSKYLLDKLNPAVASTPELTRSQQESAIAEYERLNSEERNNLQNEYDQWFNSLPLEQQISEYELNRANEESGNQVEAQSPNATRESNPNAGNQTDAGRSGEIQKQQTNQRYAQITKKAFDVLIEQLKKPFTKAFKNLSITTDWNAFSERAKALGISKKNIQRLEVLSQDFRDSHTAPLMNYDSADEAYDNGGDFNLAEVARGAHNQPSDYFDEKVGPRYYGYQDTAGMQSFTAIKNVIRALKAGKSPKDLTITLYRSVPNSVNENNLIQYDWVSPSEKYAKDHGEIIFGDGEYKIIKQEVPIAHVWWDGNDIREWGYDPSNNIRFMRTSTGEIYGAKLPDGTIYINPNNLNANTAIHEFSHLWEQVMPTSWKKGVALIKETKTGKAIFDQLKKDGNYSTLSDEQLWSEALNTHIGNYGEWRNQNPRGIMKELADWLKNLFNRLGEFFGIKINPETKLKDFTEGVVGDLLGGKALVTEVNQNQSANINYSLLTESDFDENGNVKPEVIAQIEAEQKSIIEKSKADGSYLKAPNGKNTNLNETQWVQTRTKRFKDWFGDWENDVENSSKVVDENGEPLVVYHGTKEYFNEFDSKLQTNKGFWFTPKKNLAEGYSMARNRGEIGNVIPVFLNIKNPAKNDYISRSNPNSEVVTDDMVSFDELGFDGWISIINKKITSIVALNSNQIKSATGNLGTFSANTNNINFNIVNKSNPISKSTIANVLESSSSQEAFDKLQASSWYQNLNQSKKDEINVTNWTSAIRESMDIQQEVDKAKIKQVKEKAKAEIKDIKQETKDKINELKKKYGEEIQKIKFGSKARTIERIAKIRNVQKKAYQDIINLITSNKIQRNLTPSETNRLIKAASQILTTNNTQKAVDNFIELYDKINISENQKKLENDFAYTQKITDEVKMAFADGKSLQEIYDENPTKYQSPRAKELARKVYDRETSKNNEDKNALSKLKDRQQQVKDAIYKSPKLKEAIRNIGRGFIREVSDRQFLPKNILKNINAKATYNRIISYGGASASAKARWEKIDKAIFANMTNKDRDNFNILVQQRRIISIDENRESRGLEPVNHPDNANQYTAQNALTQMKLELGQKEFDELNKKADSYFTAFKDLLSDMKKNGIINQAQYDSMADVDYQPRQFMEHLFDMEYDADNKLVAMRPISGEKFGNSTGLSKDQIRSLEEGSMGLLMDDAMLLLSNAILGRTKSFFTNNVNKTFINKDFPKAKTDYETLKSKDAKELTREDKRFIKYFEELQTYVKENPMVGITPSGKPKFKYEDLPSKGWKRAYYYENGIRKEFFMRDDFYEQWHDMMNKFIDGNAKEAVSVVTGSAITKMMATGRNPGFALVNTPRDFGSVMLFSEEYSNFSPLAFVQLMKDSVKSIADIYKHNNSNKETLLSKYLEYGGGMDFLNTEGETPMLGKLSDRILRLFNKNNGINNKTKTVAGSIFDAVTLKSLSQYSETMFRVAVFDRSIQNQLKDLNVSKISDLDQQTQDDVYTQAVVSARKVMDFNQGGRTVKALETVIPYINAATQGSRVLADSVRERPYATTARLLQGATVTASLGYAVTMALISAFKDDDDDRTPEEIYLNMRDGLSPFQKRGYIHFTTGKKNNEGELKTWKIAIAQPLTPFFTMATNVFDDVIRMKMGRKQKGIGYAFDEAQEAFSANVDPFGITEPSKLGTKNPIIKALVTYESGFDFFRDQPLDKNINKVPLALEGRQNKRVEDFYKAWGLETGMSPVRTKAAIEAMITSPDTNPFIAMTYGSVDAIVGYDSGFNEKKGFLKTVANSFERRLNSETSDANRLLNQLSPEIKKSIGQAAIEDELINEQVDKFMLKYKVNPDTQSINDAVSKISTENISAVKKANLIKNLVSRVTDFETTGGGDPRIWFIKYNTFNSAPAKAEAVVRIYGKDFQKDSKVMQSLLLNKVLTDDVWIELNQKHKVKQE